MIRDSRVKLQKLYISDNRESAVYLIMLLNTAS